jgi:alpha-1,3-rhamnosyltransferase
MVAVSVIIPAYNHQDYIAATIESVLAQTYRNIELFIVDDASSDKTAEVARGYSSECEARFADFSFIGHDVNVGIVSTLNEVIPKTRGDYVCVVASDDRFYPEKIERQVRRFAESVGDSELAAVWTNGRYIDEEGRVDEQRRLVDPAICDRVATNSSLENYRLLLNYGWYITTPSLMMSKRALLDLGLYDERFSMEDFDIVLRMLKKYRMSFIDEDLVEYRLHQTNFVKRNTAKYEMDYLGLLLREEDYCREFGMLNDWRDAIQRFAFEHPGAISSSALRQGRIFLRSHVVFGLRRLRALRGRIRRLVKRVLVQIGAYAE